MHPYSNLSKLLCHIGRLAEVKLSNFWQPITLHIAPTNKCNLNCHDCSVRNRDKNLELDYAELCGVIAEFKSRGLKSIEITGGGDPTLYPQINSLIDYIHHLNLKVGMITNGIELANNVEQETINHLTWLRISLPGMYEQISYVDALNDIDFSKTHLGFSIVWDWEKTPALLPTIDRVSRHFNANYVRIVPDCFTIREIDKCEISVPSLISGYPKFFLQIKTYFVPEKCYMGLFKPYLNADGYLYRCHTCPLFAGKFTKPFRLGPMGNTQDIWTHPEKVINFDTSQCKLCFFYEQNTFLEALVDKPLHPEFI